ncbi:glutamine amidotransferase-related protein, partial [Bacillus cereus group sp. Bce037]
MAKAMQRVLMVDNYDSFTFNIVQYLGELNADVMTYRNDEITLAQMEALAPTHLVISPGPCTPNEAGVSLAAIEHFAGRLPI